MTEKENLKKESALLEEKHYAKQRALIKTVTRMTYVIIGLVIGFVAYTFLAPDLTLGAIIFGVLAVVPLVVIIRASKRKHDMSIYYPWNEAAVSYLTACGVDVETLSPSFQNNHVYYSIDGNHLSHPMSANLYSGQAKVGNAYMKVELKTLNNGEVILFGEGKELGVK